MQRSNSWAFSAVMCSITMASRFWRRVASAGGMGDPWLVPWYSADDMLATQPTRNRMAAGALGLRDPAHHSLRPTPTKSGPAQASVRLTITRRAAEESSIACPGDAEKRGRLHRILHEKIGVSAPLHRSNSGRGVA